MSRLFLRISLGLLLALVVSSGLASQLLRMQIDRGRGGIAPDPVQRDANLVHWSLSHTTGQEQLDRIRSLQAEIAFEMRLVPSSRSGQLPPVIRNNLPSHTPLFQQFQKDKKVYLWLGEENGVLVLGPFRHRTPFSPMQLLLVTGVILPIVGLTGYLLASPVVRRLRELEEASLRIARGDLKARAGFEANDATGDLARQFNRMADRLEKLLEKQQHLLGAVSHELRTPISRIEFLLERLQTANGERERGRELADIRGELIELDDLVRELLLFTRFDAMDGPLSRASTAVTPLVEDAVARLMQDASSRGIEVRSDMTPELEFLIHPGHFRRVVHNLLVNAIRYADQQVKVRCFEEDDRLCMMVDDDGPGVPDEYRRRIFEPFFRVDEARSRESGGVGLGLAIVKRIVESYGGSIEVSESDLGGTRMMAEWPNSYPDIT